MFMCSFYEKRSQKSKKDSKVLGVFLCFWDLWLFKLLIKVGEIDPYNVNFTTILQPAFAQKLSLQKNYNYLGLKYFLKQISLKGHVNY
jgi:hypothetical protein